MSRKADAATRRRTLLLGVLAVTAVAFVAWTVAADLDVSVAVATLGGLIVSMASSGFARRVPGVSATSR